LWCSVLHADTAAPTSAPQGGQHVADLGIAVSGGAKENRGGDASERQTVSMDDESAMPASVIEEISLHDGKRMIVRIAGAADLDAVMALYDRISPDDCLLRFFTARPPTRSFMEGWLTRIDRGEGVVLVVVVESADGSRELVAETGYSLLDNGEGELGITVDPSWRGWLGPWLLAHLLAEAASRGVPNLVAIVKPTNRRMLSVMRHRRSVVIDHSDIDEIALLISTTGRTAGWPAGHDKPHILVEAASGRWGGEDAARDAGFEVRTCRGPGENRPCPLVSGGTCPLVDGADAIVTLLPDDRAGTAEILEQHRLRSDIHLVLPASGSPGPDPCQSATGVVDDIRSALGLR